MSEAALLRAFIPILRAAGRWLIRRLVEWGLPRLVVFIECRIDGFKGRLKRAKTKRRKAWLRWRISWRRRVLRWLGEQKAKLTAKAIAALDRGVDATAERIPWDTVGERYRSWLRKRAD